MEQGRNDYYAGFYALKCLTLVDRHSRRVSTFEILTHDVALNINRGPPRSFCVKDGLWYRGLVSSDLRHGLAA